MITCEIVLFVRLSPLNCFIQHPSTDHVRFLGKVQVKGKNEAVSVFEMYDGDVDHIKTLKMETITELEQGLCHYFLKEFTEAAIFFENVLRINSDDKTAKRYLERSAQFMIQGVPEAWQGIEMMDSK